MYHGWIHITCCRYHSIGFFLLPTRETSSLFPSLACSYWVCCIVSSQFTLDHLIYYASVQEDRSVTEARKRKKNIYFTYVSASDWLWLLRKIEKEACRFFQTYVFTMQQLLIFYLNILYIIHKLYMQPSPLMYNFICVRKENVVDDDAPVQD